MLLDGLKERGIKATFFLIGANTEQEESKKIVKRMYEEGHLIGNHTYRHVDLSKISGREAEKEIKTTDEAIKKITGHETEFIRPPFGAMPEGEEDPDKIYVKWTVDSPYGVIDITVNLSKPEKDPKAIAAAKNAKASTYPKCQLCVENEGYAGRVNHPARENHRIMPITINDSQWGFQYSPYVYYNEHCIVFNGQHIPMKIDRAAFIKLFDFVKQFPHYFLGSNADLPIVGGSILSHDHFQGGHYTFAMAKAPIEKEVTIPRYEDVEAGIVKWPLSVVRIRHKDEQRLIDLADHVLKNWRSYTDEDAFIFAETDGEPHNTITPIARKVGDIYELDLTLRNNITTEEHPLGLYHPHAQYHNIKKENIGLIEVMGLAVLPARLKNELELLACYIVEGKDIRSNEDIVKHADWVDGFLPKYDSITKENVMDILKEEVGIVFTHVLEDAGVYKCTEEGRNAFMKFIETL